MDRKLDFLLQVAEGQRAVFVAEEGQERFVAAADDVHMVAIRRHRGRLVEAVDATGVVDVRRAERDIAAGIVSARATLFTSPMPVASAAHTPAAASRLTAMRDCMSVPP